MSPIIIRANPVPSAPAYDSGRLSRRGQLNAIYFGSGTARAVRLRRVKRSV
ncbi:hypothetical protein RMSM_07321 [Rhodopirellula maiorica SM1]|uniref:Uncharacterized protein n=1 Tax=Rhodopirellula maiorica SM1 TaxID=1265738 RepID=M5R8N8_9BACT|nr:hypothetical protein RMSM_07321 [Rhodopirellula maiorica SM1]